MNKNFVFKLLAGLILLVAPILWLLSILIPATFGWFNLAYAVAMISFGLGLLLIIKGVFRKNSVSFKKLNIWLGIGLLIVTVISLVSAIALPKNIIIPIICILLALGLILGILATGGKNWDSGDNQQVGYKNYHQRKAEEEKNNKE